LKIIFVWQPYICRYKVNVAPGIINDSKGILVLFNKQLGSEVQKTLGEFKFNSKAQVLRAIRGCRVNKYHKQKKGCLLQQTAFKK